MYHIRGTFCFRTIIFDLVRILWTYTVWKTFIISNFSPKISLTERKYGQFHEDIIFWLKEVDTWNQILFILIAFSGKKEYRKWYFIKMLHHDEESTEWCKIRLSCFLGEIPKLLNVENYNDTRKVIIGVEQYQSNYNWPYFAFNHTHTHTHKYSSQ